jgi:hypothetical protein
MGQSALSSKTSMAITEEVARGCCRLLQIRGPNGVNNVIFKPNCAFEQLVIYFGGDVQTVEKEIKKQYLQWSLEAVVEKLAKVEEQSLVMAIQPLRMEQGTFSCFDNFVKSDWTGAPTHDFKGQGFAIGQLHEILRQADSQLPVSM